MPRYNSRTSGHRKGALERRIGGIESGRTCVSWARESIGAKGEEERRRREKTISDYIPARGDFISPTCDSV